MFTDHCLKPKLLVVSPADLSTSSPWKTLVPHPVTRKQQGMPKTMCRMRGKDFHCLGKHSLLQSISSDIMLNLSDGRTIEAPIDDTSSPAAPKTTSSKDASQSQDPTVTGASVAAQDNIVDAFDEFDPRGSVAGNKIWPFC